MYLDYTYVLQAYGSHTDIGTVNPLADTVISYATMWYAEASRTKQGKIIFWITNLDNIR